MIYWKFFKFFMVHGVLQSASFFFLGWSFKTEFGWWQDLHKEDVKILAFVNFAINIKCRTLEKKIRVGAHLYFQPLVLNPRVVQLANKIGLVFMVLNQQFGMAFNPYER